MTTDTTTPAATTLFLSQLNLNPRHRLALLDLGSPYQLHQRLLMAFDEDGDAPDSKAAPRRAGRLLFRVEPADDRTPPTIIVQARAEADWTRLARRHPGYLLDDHDGTGSRQRGDVAERLVSLLPGATMRFRLRANPVSHKRPAAADGSRRRGERVGMQTSEEQQAWLNRKLSANGAASLISCTVIDEGHQLIAKGLHDSHPMQIRSVRFEGILALRDPAALVALVTEGVGPAKSLGFGLLSLAPA